MAEFCAPPLLNMAAKVYSDTGDVTRSMVKECGYVRFIVIVVILWIEKLILNSPHFANFRRIDCGEKRYQQQQQ